MRPVNNEKPDCGEQSGSEKTVETSTSDSQKIAQPGGFVKDNARKESPLKAIRRHCLDCSGGNLSEVRNCTISECALLPFRFGNNPNKQGSRKPVVKGLTTPYQQPDQAKESGVMIEDFSKSILEGIESIELEYGNIDLSEIPTADDLFRGLK